MLLGPVSTPHLTLNVSSSDHCQRSILTINKVDLKLYFSLQSDIRGPPHRLGWSCDCYKHRWSQEETIQELSLTPCLVPRDGLIFQDNLVVTGQDRGTFVQPNHYWSQHGESQHRGNQETQGGAGPEGEEESERERQGVGFCDWDDHSHWSDSLHHPQHRLQVSQSEGFHSDQCLSSRQTNTAANMFGHGN